MRDFQTLPIVVLTQKVQGKVRNLIFFKKIFIYLFLFLAVLGLSCSTRDLRRGTRASISSCGVRAPERAGSVVSAHRLSKYSTQA